MVIIIYLDVDMGKKIGLLIATIILFGAFSVDLSVSSNHVNFDNFNNGINSDDTISLSLTWERELKLEGCSPHYADLNGDGFLDIVFLSGSYLYCLNGRTGKTIWSQSESFKYISTPCIVDIDNDSQLEIITLGGLDSDTIFIYDFKGNKEKAVKISENYGIYPFHTSSPCIGDQDLDGVFEIIIGTRFGIICINADDFSRWEYTTDNDVYCTPSLLNVDSDPEYEIVFTCIDGYIYCIDDQGDFLWKTALIGELSTGSSPAIYDVDLDGKHEIYVGTGERFCNYDSDGSLLWSVTATATEYETFEGSPVIANIDNEGSLEILIQSSSNKLYCFSSNGSLNWTTDAGSHSPKSSVVLSDLTGDGNQEIIVVNYEITCLDYNGTVLDAYPIHNFSYSNPLVGDLNLDGKNNIFCGEYNDKVKCLEINTSQDSGISVWPCFLGSNYHTGFGDYDGDLLDELTEKFYCTNETNADTDSDGFLDGWEIMVGLNPLVFDRYDDLDNDNLANNLEATIYHTSVFTADTDGDGVDDGEEILLGRDPLIYDDNESTLPTTPFGYSAFVPVNNIYVILFATVAIIVLTKKKRKKF